MKSQISMLRWSSVLLLGWRTMVTAQLIIPSTARWAKNATTVAGSASAQSGSTSSLLNTPYGIHITDDDTLFIADRINHRIVVIRLNSTTAVQVIGTGFGTAQNQLQYPTDVFVTTTAVFVLDSSNYRVQRYSRDGTQVSTVAGNTDSVGGSASLTSFGTSYALFADVLGYLYVSDSNNHRVLRFPPNTSNGTSAVVVAGTGTIGSWAAMLSNPRGIFVDDDNDFTLYVADASNDRIQRWNRNACFGVTVAGTGVPGSSLSQLSFPVAVVVDTNSYMYITDQANNRILRWLVGACSGECIASCSNSGSGSTADKLSTPRSVVFDSQGSLYVSDSSNHRVQKFLVLSGGDSATSMSTAGSWTSTASTGVLASVSVNLPTTARWVRNATTVAGSASAQSGSTSSLLNTPYGIHITDDDTLFIADRTNHRIVVIRLNSTTAVQVIGTGFGTAQNQLQYPTDVFVTTTAVFVLDSGNYRVQRYSRDGTQVSTVAGNTDSVGGSASLTSFGTSYGLFADVLGYLYVSDSNNHRVLRFPPNTSNGTSAVVVAGTGTIGSWAAMLSNPRGIFVDDDDDFTLYVADASNDRIQRWDRNACFGVTVAGTGVSGSSLSQLSFPMAVVVDANSYMYITDQGNNRILRWLVGACSGECIASCSNSGSGSTADKLSTPRAVVFDSQGSLYVSDSSNHRVQKFLIVPSTSGDSGTSMSTARTWTTAGGTTSASMLTLSLMPTTSKPIQMVCFYQANLSLNSSGPAIQWTQLTSITCNQCFCMLLQSNVWTTMACQPTQSTCQIVALNLQSLNQYVRIDTSSVVCYPSQSA